jgi:hypothetical protein
MSIHRLGCPREKGVFSILSRQRIIKVDVEILATLFREFTGKLVFANTQQIEVAVERSI